MINSKTQSLKKQIKIFLLPMFFGYITILIISFLYLTTKKEIFCKSIQNMFSPNLIMLIAAFACTVHFASIFFESLRPIANYYYKHCIDLTSILFGASCSLLTAYYFAEFGLSFHREILFKAVIVFSGLLPAFFFITILPYQIFLNLKIELKNINKRFIHLLSFALIAALPLSTITITFVQNWSYKDMTICEKNDTVE